MTIPGFKPKEIVAGGGSSLWSTGTVSSANVDDTLWALCAAAIDAGWTETRSNDGSGGAITSAAGFAAANSWIELRAPTGTLYVLVKKGPTPSTDHGIAAKYGAFSGGGSGVLPTGGTADTSEVTLLPLGAHDAVIRVQTGSPWGLHMSVDGGPEILQVIPSEGSSLIAILVYFGGTHAFFPVGDSATLADVMTNR